jgi:Ca2+-binding EF-hand superfamily protein
MKLRMIVVLGAMVVLLATGSESFAEEADPSNFVAAFKARFDLMDANKDGKVTREEYVKFQSKRLEKRFNQLDKNKTGYVTKEEVEQLAEEASKKAKKSAKQWQEVHKQWQEKKKQQMEQQQQQQQ